MKGIKPKIIIKKINMKIIKISKELKNNIFFITKFFEKNILCIIQKVYITDKNIENKNMNIMIIFK